jgi:hypothetical protein
MIYQQEILLKSTSHPTHTVKLRIREPKQDVLLINFKWNKKSDSHHEDIAVHLHDEERIVYKRIKIAAERICEYLYISYAEINSIAKMLRDMVNQVL